MEFHLYFCLILLKCLTLYGVKIVGVATITNDFKKCSAKDCVNVTLCTANVALCTANHIFVG